MWNYIQISLNEVYFNRDSKTEFHEIIIYIYIQKIIKNIFLKMFNFVDMRIQTVKSTYLIKDNLKIVWISGFKKHFHKFYR